LNKKTIDRKSADEPKKFLMQQTAADTHNQYTRLIVVIVTHPILIITHPIVIVAHPILVTAPIPSRRHPIPVVVVPSLSSSPLHWWHC
jgi:hypothetical protein